MDQEPKISNSSQEGLCLNCGQKHNLNNKNSICHDDMMDDYMEYVSSLNISREDQLSLINQFEKLDANEAFKFLQDAKNREKEKVSDNTPHSSFGDEDYSADKDTNRYKDIESSGDVEKERVCSRCFKKLSRYNKTDECFSHVNNISDEESIKSLIDNLGQEDRLVLKRIMELNKEEQYALLDALLEKMNKENRLEIRGDRGGVVSKKRSLEDHDKFDS